MARCKEVPVAVSEESVRVLYLNYEWDPRESPGALTHIRELSRGLEDLGHTVIVEDRHRVRHAVQSDCPRASVDDGHPKWSLRGLLSPYLHESAALWRAFRGIG